MFKIIKNKLLNSLYIGIILLFALIIYLYTLKSDLLLGYNIKIQGNNYINKSTIKNIIFEDKPSAILNFNLLHMQKKIELIEFIDIAQIAIILPNTIIINIIESEPIMLLNYKNKNNFIDHKGNFLSVNNKSNSTFKVPKVSMIIDDQYENYLNQTIQIFNYLLIEHIDFYNSINEIIINKNEWKFLNKTNTIVYINRAYINKQLTTLKYFESTISPIKNLNDYKYIDLRIDNQVVVKEKYHKG